MNWDYYFIQRQAWIADMQRKDDPWIDMILWCLLGMILTACLMAAVPDYQDFTDQGLGCIDCLEPAEPMPVEP